MLGICKPRTLGLKLFSFFSMTWYLQLSCLQSGLRSVTWTQIHGEAPACPNMLVITLNTLLYSYTFVKCRRGRWSLDVRVIVLAVGEPVLLIFSPHTVINAKLWGEVSLHHHSLSSPLIYFSVIYDLRSRLCISKSKCVINWLHSWTCGAKCRAWNCRQVRWITLVAT